MYAVPDMHMSTFFSFFPAFIKYLQVFYHFSYQAIDYSKLISFFFISYACNCVILKRETLQGSKEH